MPKISDCNRCQFYSRDYRLLCAVHPYGPDGDTCQDFIQNSEYPRRQLVDSLSVWQETETSAHYARGETMQLQMHQTRAGVLERFVSHPMFTGQCPECAAEMERDGRDVVRWNCECGWTDNLIWIWI